MVKNSGNFANVSETSEEFHRGKPLVSYLVFHKRYVFYPSLCQLDVNFPVKARPFHLLQLLLVRIKFTVGRLLTFLLCSDPLFAMSFHYHFIIFSPGFLVCFCLYCDMFLDLLLKSYFLLKRSSKSLSDTYWK